MKPQSHNRLSACNRIQAVVCSLPRASLHLGVRFGSPVSWIAGLGWCELRSYLAASPCIMIARRRARATRALRIVDRLAIAKALVLEFELALVAGQHDVGGRVQEGSYPPVAAFGDAAGVVIDLARLIPFGDQAQIGADVSGSADARGARRLRPQRRERSTVQRQGWSLTGCRPPRLVPCVSCRRRSQRPPSSPRSVQQSTRAWRQIDRRSPRLL